MKAARRKGAPIRLLSDRVLVRLIAPERTSHGLYIPETAKRQPWELWRAIVIATGPGLRGRRRMIPTEASPDPEPIYCDRVTPCSVKPGDLVLFSWVAGKVLVTTFGDENHRIIHDSDIQAVLE